MGSERTVLMLFIATWLIATCSYGMAVDKQEVYQPNPFDGMNFEEKDEEATNKRISFGTILGGGYKNGKRDNWEERDIVDDTKITRRKRSPRTSINPYNAGNSYDRNTRQWGSVLGRGFKLGRRSYGVDDDDDFDDYIEKRRLGLVLGNGLLVGKRPDSHHGHHQNHHKTNMAQRDSSSYTNAQTRTSPNHTGRHGSSNPNVAQSNSNNPASRSSSNSYPAQRSSPNNAPSRASSYISGYGASPQNPNIPVPNNGYYRSNGYNPAQRNSYDTAQRNPYNTAQRSVYNSPPSNPHNSPLSSTYNALQSNPYNLQQRTYPNNVYVDIDDLYDSDEYERRLAQQMLSQASRSQPISNNPLPSNLRPYKTYRTYIDSSGEVETDSVEVYPNPYALQSNSYNQRTYG
ncbi:hypothetical protein CHS0354_014957 [Potamilus streckersoni]|uniref:Uncharacterized protein n=1 Tax=Potamilus streckersoni TaxID=2493646 RepID=A0AAE0S894_9BIVA|nr:hypothetical protein CHS0354_014957 [Potamilus streckersoni]